MQQATPLAQAPAVTWDVLSVRSKSGHLPPGEIAWNLLPDGRRVVKRTVSETQLATEDDVTRRILIFDFDGTLADTMRELVDGLVQTLRDQLGGEEDLHRDLVMQLIYTQQRD